MPIPKPRKGESHEDFMSRCAGDTTMNHDYQDNEQRVAVCFSAWRDAHGNSGVGKPPKAMETEGMVQRDAQMKWMATTLEVKGLNDGQRTLMGTATNSDIDMVGDIVVSTGVRYSLPVPLLLHHDHRLPVGHVQAANPSNKGIDFQARIAKIDTPGTLQDRCNEAWDLVRSKLIRGVSIGFTAVPEQVERLKSGGLKFNQWLWHELSLVVVPANQSATISVVRSLDALARGVAAGSLVSPTSAKPAPAPVSVAAVEQPDAILRWVNDFSNKRQWNDTLEEAPRWSDPNRLAKFAAARIRSRQPQGDITQKQVQFEMWELRRFW